MSAKLPSPLARLGAAQAVSVAGDRLHHLAAIAYFTGLAGASGESRVSLLFALSAVLFLPGLLVTPLVGPLVDRLPPARVLALVDAARAGLVLLLAAVLALANPFASLAALFAFHSLNAFFLPARGALPPELVPPSRLAAANAALAAAAVAAAVLASAAGGVWVDRFGWAAALSADAATYAASAVLLGTLWRAAPRVRSLQVAPEQVAPEPGAPKPGAPERVLPPAGGRFSLLWIGLRARRATAVWMALWGAGGVLHVAGVDRWLGDSGRVAGLGLLGAALALGAITGALGMRSSHRVRPGAALRLAGSAAALGVAAVARHPALVAAALFALGALAAPLAAWSESELQRAVPRARRASTIAAREAVARLAFLAGGAAALLAAPRLGTGGALWIGVAALAVGPLAVLPKRGMSGGLAPRSPHPPAPRPLATPGR